MMAIEMQWKMEELGDKWKKGGIEFPLKMRFGINTGMAIYGNYGTTKRRKYAALSKDVNLVSRIEKACSAGNILLSFPTYALVKDKIPCKEAGKIQAKGFHKSRGTYVVELDKITPKYIQDLNSYLSTTKSVSKRAA
jgi:class 3 adenylate cyclase